MKNCSEVSRITGVSVRTLHYYDEIGLLRPTAKSKSGYRLYDDTAVSGLKVILLFRELGFSLDEIKKITGNPTADIADIAGEQIKLLTVKKEHLEKLIASAEKIMKGDTEDIDFSVFGKNGMDKYKNEVIEKWGNTEAYKEYSEKCKGKTFGYDEKLMSIFGKLGNVKDESPKSEVAKEYVSELRKYITDNYYSCTPEILKSLGEMYAEDDRFRENIDSVGGKGTAEFTRLAISEYLA